MDFKSFASSASKKIMLKETMQRKSLMYTRNRRGPKMLPWGMPDLTGSKSEE